MNASTASLWHLSHSPPETSTILLVVAAVCAGLVQFWQSFAVLCFLFRGKEHSCSVVCAVIEAAAAANMAILDQYKAGQSWSMLYEVSHRRVLSALPLKLFYSNKFLSLLCFVGSNCAKCVNVS